MAAPSRTPPSAGGDEPSPLERAKRNALILGLFLPLQNGGWSPSTAPRGTSWSFDYNARLAVRADELGLDLVFGLAQWRGKGGYGGATRYREMSLDPFIVTAGLAPLTRSIMLIATVHVLYGGWHPLHLAKFGATIDVMSGGRWGVNIVTGYAPYEIRMFGQAPIEHDLRYEMAAEFTDVMEALWSSDENLTYEGRFWSTHEAFVSPKPVHGRPLIVNAGSSDAGLAFAARYSDLVFITSPAGADLERALEALPAHNARVKALAAAQGRKVRTIINPMVICRETEREVRQVCRTILDGEDAVAVDNLMASFAGSDARSFRGHRRAERIIGGNVQLFGTPEQIVDHALALKRAGCDGLQLSFFDFEPDLELFGRRVLPLMKEAGLRA